VDLTLLQQLRERIHTQTVVKVAVYCGGGSLKTTQQMRRARDGSPVEAS